MRFLEHTKVSSRLLAMAIISACIALALGLLGMVRTAEVNGMLTNLYEDNLVPVADIGNANMQANRIDSDLDTTLAYVRYSGSPVVCPPATKRAFQIMLPSLFRSNMR